MKKLIIIYWVILCLLNIVNAAISINPLFEENKNPNAVEGIISFDMNFYNSLAALYSNPNEAITKGVKVELWRVIYQDMPNQSNEPIVAISLAEKNLTVSVEKSSQTTDLSIDVSYRISNIPEQGNYIVLTYFDKTPQKYSSYKLIGKADDYSGRNNLRYKSDAKIYIGQEKIWSLYSIPKFTTSIPLINGLNFITANNNLVSIHGISLNPIDWVDDLFSGLKDLVFEGGKKISGYVINAAGNVILRVGGEVITLYQTGGFSKSREMTQAEYDWANKIFNGTLPPRNNITLTNLRWDRNRPYVWANIIGTGITMNMSDLYDNPMANEMSRGTFIHELTHVWQYHHRSLFNYTIEGIGNFIAGEESYDYKCGKNWNEYNFEQQGEIVKDYYSWREYGLLPSWNINRLISTVFSLYPENQSSNYPKTGYDYDYNNTAPFNIINFKGCLSCQEELVINNIRFGKRFDIIKIVDEAFSGKNFNLFEGNYSISSPLRISKRMTIGTCSGTAIIGKN